jgi:hypothetical protein
MCMSVTVSKVDICRGWFWWRCEVWLKNVWVPYFFDTWWWIPLPDDYNEALLESFFGKNTHNFRHLVHVDTRDSSAIMKMSDFERKEGTKLTSFHFVRNGDGDNDWMWKSSWRVEKVNNKNNWHTSPLYWLTDCLPAFVSSLSWAFAYTQKDFTFTHISHPSIPALNVKQF